MSYRLDDPQKQSADSRRRAKSDSILDYELFESQAGRFQTIGRDPQACPGKKVSSRDRQELSVGGNPRCAALSRRARALRQSHVDDVEINASSCFLSALVK